MSGEQRCPHCHRKLEDLDSAFCSHCGAYLGDDFRTGNLKVDTGWYPDDLAGGFYLRGRGRTGFPGDQRAGFTAPPVDQYYCSHCGMYIPSRDAVNGTCPRCYAPLVKSGTPRPSPLKWLIWFTIVLIVSILVWFRWGHL